MSYKVVQWATGAVGCHAIKGIANRTDLELVGVFVNNPEKVGRDAGELAGIKELNIQATNDIDALLALQPDCIHYSPLYPDFSLICRILSQGINIITPSAFWYPALNPKVQQRLQDACIKGGASIHGSGIHPGVTERLALTMAAASLEVEQIIIQEVCDLSDHPSAEQMFDGFGFGRDYDDCVANPSPIAGMMGTSFRESQALIAAGLGVQIERFEEHYEVAKTKQALALRCGIIEAGCVAGMHWEWRSYIEGKAEPLLVYKTYWRMGANLEPDWGHQGLHYTVQIKGSPAFHCEFAAQTELNVSAGADDANAGLAATAMHGVNIIPAVCDALPGVQTILDLGLFNGVGLVKR